MNDRPGAIRPERVAPVPLEKVARAAGVTGDLPSLPVTGITLDSRSVEEGWIYAALPGARTHGARFAAQAVAAGAVALLTDEDGAALAAGAGVPLLVSGDVRGAMARAAAVVYGEPSRAMTMLGVTGTNGKTTTVALLQAGLAAAGRLAGTIGTIGFRLGAEAVDSARGTVTTPDSPDLQALLAVLAQRGADAVALEVSSHALALQRVDAVSFDCVAFLNLGRDHLDFHRNLDDYFEAKARLFEPGRSSRAVVWTDDPAGRILADRIRADRSTTLITAGTTPDADYRMSDVCPVGRLGAAGEVVAHGDRFPLAISLPGFYNMVDAVVALAMLEAVGVPREAALAGLAGAQVPGRMEQVVLDGVDAPLVVVDFAHTPQAVGAALSALTGDGELITVLGCGGDRDADKRAPMGAAAAEASAVVIVTDDNPRGEDPASIRAAVLDGARRAATASGATVLEVPGRRAAIRDALARASRDSVVAVLGKGHERGQILADRIIDFDDRIEVRDAWLSRTGAHPRLEGKGDASAHRD
ncbi:MAG TPA: UDP-N-acetylmuramoyl-L-alanyl-D-glutamate--2,6-diaminopimelate ligase [Arachnia sp.]|nr:UDP-N-acetylmuramoyl-L-alanyl-D-glutamate--2,6-diaminopimelate ligase [Arachnia sp.]HMT86334.1 UDP-N-acetylmuramoyl-L-alanyl-D-glutamate--2,6-diaminopimelate ligase [Arachnia sp.]